MSPIGSFAIIILFGASLVFSTGEDCIFTDSITNEYKLDLSSLMGEDLTYCWPSCSTKYNYTVCANNLSCDQQDPQQESMVSIGRYFHPPLSGCNGIANFDKPLQSPKYYPAQGNTRYEHWEIVYEGMECIADNGSETTYYTWVEWWCWPYEPTEIIAARVAGPDCGNLVVIRSPLVCTNNTTN